MKSKIITLLINIVIAIVFSGSSCDNEPNDKDIMFYNNSNDGIYIYQAIVRDFDYEIDIKDFYETAVLYPVIPKNECFLHRIHEVVNNKAELVLHIITFKKATIDEYGWTRIVDENIYDEYLKYSYKELEAMNFRVVYGGYRD